VDEGVGSKGKKMVLRLKPGEELVECLLKAYEENGFKNAIITGCIGSLKKIAYKFAIKDKTKPLGFRYCDNIQEEGIIEFIGAQGNICRDTEGKLLYHIHAVFVDDTGKVKGGHLIDRSNEVLATMEICLEEIEDIVMIRVMDDMIKAPVLTFFKP